MSHTLDTFISYRRSASMHLARNVFMELNRRGIDTFLDVESIDSTQFDTFILNQIAARPNFVFLMSSEALKRCVNAGDWLLRELEHAYKLKRNIVPVYDAGFDWGIEKVYLPEHLRDFLSTRNAVSYTHEYYHAFMDKIARFIRHPQDHGPIEIRPAPPAEVKQAQTLIQQALVIQFDAVGVVEAVGRFYELRAIAQTSTDWQDLLHIWSEIRLNENAPNFIDMQGEENQIRQALEKQLALEEAQRRYTAYVEEREKAYDFVRKLAERSTVPRAAVQKTLGDFWQKYQEYESHYDPDELGELTRALKKAIRFSGKRNSEWTPYMTSLGELVPSTPLPDMPMCLVPVGKFMMGSDNGESDEKPVHEQVIREPYWIARYPVTNAQWRVAVKAKAVKAPENKEWYDDESMAHSPVVSVNWYECLKFAQWAKCNLPSEPVWEYAARGVENLEYPWGNKFEGERVIYDQTPVYGNKKPAPIDSRLQGASWVGAEHLSGNVWEWQLSAYAPYPYVSGDGREDVSRTNGSRVLRGGSFNNGQLNARSVYRLNDDPNDRYSDSGFRVVFSLKIPSGL